MVYDVLIDDPEVTLGGQLGVYIYKIVSNDLLYYNRITAECSNTIWYIY